MRTSGLLLRGLLRTRKSALRGVSVRASLRTEVRGFGVAADRNVVAFSVADRWWVFGCCCGLESPRPGALGQSSCESADDLRLPGTARRFHARDSSIRQAKAGKGTIRRVKAVGREHSAWPPTSIQGRGRVGGRQGQPVLARAEDHPPKAGDRKCRSASLQPGITTRRLDCRSAGSALASARISATPHARPTCPDSHRREFSG